MFGRGFRQSGRAARARQIRRGAALVLAAALVSACGSAATATPAASQAVTPPPSSTPLPSISPSPSPVPSATPWPSGRVLAYDVATGKAAPVAPSADRGAASGALIDGFAFDIFGRIDPNGNLCFSPTSIALALAMVRAGARGATATQMDTVLHQFGASGQEAQIAALLQQLRGQTLYIDSQGVPLEPTDTPDPAQPDPVTQLTVANQLFAQKNMSLEAAYLDALSSTYGAGVGLLDFQNDPESARLTINKWASDNTRGRIPDVLQPGDVQPATRIALANAIYLKANWRDKFDPQQTKPGQFTTSNGTKVTVPMMSIEAPFAYGAGTGYRAVEVPLDVMSSLSMVFVVPDDMAVFGSQLTAAKFSSVIGSMKTYDVSFWLPKFSVESRMDLAGLLSEMGMVDLFSAGAADLSGITTDEKLFIDKVIHQANMDVDEEGVTAAAVTVAVGLGGAGQQPPHVDFRVDKPFFYFIRESRSGAILFMGRINDASSRS